MDANCKDDFYSDISQFHPHAAEIVSTYHHLNYNYTSQRTSKAVSKYDDLMGQLKEKLIEIDNVKEQ